MEGGPLKGGRLNRGSTVVMWHDMWQAWITSPRCVKLTSVSFKGLIHGQIAWSSKPSNLCIFSCNWFTIELHLLKVYRIFLECKINVALKNLHLTQSLYAIQMMMQLQCIFYLLEKLDRKLFGLNHGILSKFVEDINKIRASSLHISCF